MTVITVEGPSTNPVEELAAAENVSNIKAAIAKAHQEYLTTNKVVTVQLGAGT